METERRIEKLEQEIEILKHQIQETLLDIQEKMLNRTHPSLRSGVQPQPDPDPEEALNPNERPTELHRPKDLSQRAPEPKQSSPAKPQPSVGKPNKVVSITDYTGTSPKNAPVPEIEEIDWEELDRMEAWVMHKLKSMGISKTRKLIRLHVSKGRLSKDMGTALLQFVSLYDKQHQETTSSTQNAEQQEDPGEQNLILRLIAGVSNAGMRGRKHG